MTFLPKNTFVCSVKSGAFKALSRGSKLLFPGILHSGRVGKLACFAIGVGAVITGLTSAVSASPIVLSKQSGDFNRISSQSLGQLENRNLSKDYSSILSETKPIAEMKPILLNHNSSTPIIKISAEVLELIKKVEVNTGGSSLDCDQVVKVRYHMD